MLKASNYDTELEEIGRDTLDNMDTDLQGDGSSAQAYFEGEQLEDSTDSGEEYKANNYNFNQELRLVNAYFKEVGTETLLTPREEVLVAAKIKECETQTAYVIKSISGILGYEPSGDRREYSKNIVGVNWRTLLSVQV